MKANGRGLKGHQLESRLDLLDGLSSTLLPLLASDDSVRVVDLDLAWDSQATRQGFLGLALDPSGLLPWARPFCGEGGWRFHAWAVLPAYDLCFPASFDERLRTRPGP